MSQLTAGAWIERLRHRIIHLKGTSAETWQGDYWKVLQRLPMDEPLTAEALEALIDRSKPNTKTRKRTCMAVNALARLAKIDYDASPFAGNYGIKSVNPRELVDDPVIVEWRDRLKNPAWRWVYGLIATYGLRPHEVFRIDFDRLRSGNNVLAVEDETKTGWRFVWAFYPEWFEEFELQNVCLPGINLERSNIKVGNSVSHYFRDTARTPFTMYTLRHCWAVRTMLYGLPDALAAQQMGHSLDVHQRVYYRWIVERHHQQMYNTLLTKPDRPLAPPKPDIIPPKSAGEPSGIQMNQPTTKNPESVDSSQGF